MTTSDTAATWTRLPKLPRQAQGYLRSDGKVVIRGRGKDYRIYDIVGGREIPRHQGPAVLRHIVWYPTLAEAQAANTF